MDLRRILLLTTIVLCASLAVSLSYFYDIPAAGEQKTFGKAFSLTLKDYQGNDVHLHEFRGQVLIAYAWASWCPYCGAEIQNLSAMKRTYGDDIDIIAINRAEPVVDAKGYTDQLQGVEQIHFLIDPSDEFFKTIGGFAMPETVFITPDGTVLYHQRGPIKLPEVEAKIQELLK